MAKKQSGTGAKKSAPKKAPAPKKVTKVTSKEEAVALLKERMPNAPSNVSYIVLENCNIFYGYNKAAALKFADNFNLKHFEVKA